MDAVFEVENGHGCHGKAIRCLKFSRGVAAGSVFATGGDDKMVKLFRVGRANPVNSMSGNASSVVGLSFSPNEQQLLSASEGGSLKIFDLAEGRVSRSLNGHLAKVNGCDYHPYGEFIVSGGDDTNVKVWDVRHKRCIQTYKGHSRYVTDIGFSPDGQWVASCSKLDGTLKIWDLIAGKQLHSFSISTEGSNNGPTSFEFNPCEFLMAVTAGDSMVKFLDMERFEVMGSTPNDPSKVNRICWFDGSQSSEKDGVVPAKLLSATNDSLRSWEVDPTITCNAWADARWGGAVADMVVNQSRQLVVGSFQDEFFNIHAVEIDALPKRGGMVGRAGAGVGGIDGHCYESSPLRIASSRRADREQRDKDRERSTRTPTQSNLGVGVVGVGVSGSAGMKLYEGGREERERGSYRRTPSPQQKYTVETPPSSEAKPGGRRLKDGGGVGGRAVLDRESPVPPTFHYNDERKDDSEGYDGEDDVVMPNEYKRGGRGDESDDDFLSDTAAMNIVEAVVASSTNNLDDIDDSMSPSFTSLNSSNTSNDDSSKANLGHIYDFAAAMGAGSPGVSPIKDKAGSGGDQKVFPGAVAGAGVDAGQLEDAIVAAQKAVGGRLGDAEKENKAGAGEEKEVSFSMAEERGGRGRKGENSLNYNLPVSNFHQGIGKDGKGHMEDGSMDDQIIGQILLGRLGLSSCLVERMEKLQKLHGRWESGDLRGTIIELEDIVNEDEDGAMDGAAVVIDFLKNIEVRRLKLEDCGSLLRVLCKIILGGEEGEAGEDGDLEDTIGGSSTSIKGRPFAGSAMGKFATILESFGRLVFETCLNGESGFGVGVDVEGEGRLKRCLLCHESFAKLADKMCGEKGQEKDDGGDGGFGKGGKKSNKSHSSSSSSVMFMGLIDMKDKEAKKEAKKLASLLDRYRRGKI